MKCWDYRGGSPWIPVTLFGGTIIEGWAFVDTGAGYCVVHPKIHSSAKIEKGEGGEVIRVWK